MTNSQNRLYHRRISRKFQSFIVLLAAGLATGGTVPVHAESANPLYRLYNPGSGEHFYTKSQNEKNTLFQLGWIYEGIGWNAPQNGSPVYRVYNPNSGEHHFTMDLNERSVLVQLGWKDEGTAFFASDSSSVPVYRLFNPYATDAGSHHYTTSVSEMNLLVKAGWKNEGIGWHAQSEGSLLGKAEKYQPNKDLSTTASRIRLNIPQKVQENSYYCGPTSLQMVLAYHDISVSQDQLAEDLKTSPVTGTEYDDLARTASRYIFGNVPTSDADPGYRAVILPAWSSDPTARSRFEQRAVSDLSNGDPVFVSINNEIAYGPGYGTVHQVVLYGVDLDNSGKALRFYYLDPSYKQQDPVYGGKKAVNANEMWQIMTQNPEPGYVW